MFGIGMYLVILQKIQGRVFTRTTSTKLQGAGKMALVFPFSKKRILAKEWP